MINVVERFSPESVEDKFFNLASSSRSYLNYTCTIFGFSHGLEPRSLKPTIHQHRNTSHHGIFVVILHNLTLNMLIRNLKEIKKAAALG